MRKSGRRQPEPDEVPVRLDKADEPQPSWQRFETLAQPLLAVPEEEMDEGRASYEELQGEREGQPNSS